MTTLFNQLRRDERGMAIIEFAFVAPTFFMLMMATFDLGQTAYVSNVLTGEVQKAGRDATLEGASSNTSTLDDRIKSQAGQAVGSGGTWSFERKFYPSFTKAGQQENFSDGDNDGLRDPGECFQDENANGKWDAVGGRTGQGGADDIVVYTASVTYPRLFPMYKMLGWSQNQTVTATTVLRNQPFGDQAVYTPVTICT